MAKLVLISDTHTFQDNVYVPECDILLHAGDSTLRGSFPEFQKFALWFSKQPAKHKIAIPGNHDFICEQMPALAKETFTKLGCTLLIDEATTAEGLRIYGTPWQPWFHSWAFNLPQYEPRKSEKAKFVWSQIPKDTDILIVHGPPHGILDKVRHPRVGEDPHVGCPHLLKKINNLYDLKLVVCGHIHEQYGQSATETGVLVVNAALSGIGDQYRIINQPVEVTL